jgi:hypothetical protein
VSEAPEKPQRNRGGRPRKPRPLETEEGRALAAKITEAETHALAAGDAFRKKATMANKAEMLAAELRAAALQRAWCLLAGDHTHALRWAEILAKLSREHAAAAEARAIDEAAELAERTEKERAVARKLGGKRATPARA